MTVLLDVLILFVIVVCVACWAGATWRVSAGRPLVAYQPRRPVPWGFADLLFALLALLLFQTLAIHFVSLLALAEATRRIVEILCSALGSLATINVSLAVIFLNTRSDWRDLGFDRRRLVADLKLGVVAFLMLAPPVYGLQYVLIRWFPSEHPLIALLTEDGSLTVYLVVGFSAVIVAPLVEEYLFRVLLQGWIERVLTPNDRGVAASMDGASDRPACDRDEKADLGGRSNAATEIRWLPILISSTLFASLHASHGPDPVPLFVLALGLGYLYQRTHRLLPCVIVHFLLNGVTLAAFLLGVESV